MDLRPFLPSLDLIVLFVFWVVSDGLLVGHCNIYLEIVRRMEVVVLPAFHHSHPTFPEGVIVCPHWFRNFFVLGPVGIHLPRQVFYRSLFIFSKSYLRFPLRRLILAPSFDEPNIYHSSISLLGVLGGGAL